MKNKTKRDDGVSYIEATGSTHYVHYYFFFNITIIRSKIIQLDSIVEGRYNKGTFYNETLNKFYYRYLIEML